MSALPSGRWLIAAALLGLSARPAGADITAHTCHVGPTGGAVLRLTDFNPRGGAQPCTGFEVTVGGKRTSRGRLGFPGSGVFLSTADGRTVIFVQSRPYISDRGALAGTPGVVFFRDGKELASYTIGELVERPHAVMWSKSHAHWVGGLDEGQGEPYALPEATWALQTTSLRRITFDTATGRIVRAEDAPPWDECDLIARGQVVRSGGVLEFHPTSVLKGELAVPVPLPPSAEMLEGSFETVCLARAADGVRFIRKLGQR